MFHSLKSQQSTALLVLRIALGAIFLYHGMMKWQMADANTLMTILGFVEPIAGIAILLGIVSELAAVALGVVMLGAIYMKMTGFGQGALDVFGTFAKGGGWEFDLILLSGCLIVLCFGAGKYSIDAALRK